MGTVSRVDPMEIPGGLFTASHWDRVARDLLRVVMQAHPTEWQNKVHRDTQAWADERLEYEEKSRRLAKEKALAKLTFDDKIALGLPT